MSSLSAFKTDTLATFARYCLLEHACLFDKAVAASPRAPLEIRVQIDVDVHLELKKLLIDFLRAKLSHIFVCESDCAANHHAWDLHHIAILDIAIKMFFHTLLAVVVLAFETEEACLI